MKEILFNSNWMYALGSYEFLSTPTEAFVNVNLPHDAMIHETRKQNLPDGRNTGFYPHGIYEYKKIFCVQMTGDSVNSCFCLKEYMQEQRFM